MREIKFRAWSKEFKKMCYAEMDNDSYGHLLVSPKEEGWGIIGLGFNGKVLAQGYQDVHATDNYIPMQFTGLLDKNNKDIYKGDIVKRRIYDSYDKSVYHIGEVVFSPIKGFGFHNKYRSGYLGLTVIKSRMEIIGNIYENPELISNTPTTT